MYIRRPYIIMIYYMRVHESTTHSLTPRLWWRWGCGRHGAGSGARLPACCSAGVGAGVGVGAAVWRQGQSRSQSQSECRVPCTSSSGKELELELELELEVSLCLAACLSRPRTPLSALKWLTTATRTHASSAASASASASASAAASAAASASASASVGPAHSLNNRTGSSSRSCHVWSIRKQLHPTNCDQLEFAFEVSWLRVGCAVTMTYSAFSSKCSRQLFRDATALGIVFIPFRRSQFKPPPSVNMIRIHDNGRGSAVATLSGMYLRQAGTGSVLQDISLLSLDLAVNPIALQDEGAGDSSARAWRLWCSHKLLQSAGLAVWRVEGRRAVGRQEPAQFTGKPKV
jgi:hypothetical protein